MTDMTGSPIVDQMMSVKITGNIVPLSWLKNITYDNGKPAYTAILLLADIVYWYTPTEQRAESGETLGLRKKIKADLLQRSYAQITEIFGFSKKEARCALELLERIGVIYRDLRTVVINGKKNSNVMYIGLCVDRLTEITYPQKHQQSTPHNDNDQGSTQHSVDTPLGIKNDHQCGTLRVNKGGTPQVMTNTNITDTDITILREGRKKARDASASLPPSHKNNIPYNEILHMFAEKCSALPAPQKLTQQRSRALATLVRELCAKNDNPIDVCSTLFDRVARSRFLCGDNPRGWRATFDWVIKTQNALRIMEGVYDDRGKPLTGKKAGYIDDRAQNFDDTPTVVINGRPVTLEELERMGGGN